jgi:ShET2 enterotoxin, N-terminal region
VNQAQHRRGCRQAGDKRQPLRDAHRLQAPHSAEQPPITPLMPAMRPVSKPPNKAEPDRGGAFREAGRCFADAAAALPKLRYVRDLVTLSVRPMPGAKLPPVQQSANPLKSAASSLEVPPGTGHPSPTPQRGKLGLDLAPRAKPTPRCGSASLRPRTAMASSGANGAVLLCSCKPAGIMNPPLAAEAMPLGTGEAPDNADLDQTISWLIEQGNLAFAHLRVPDNGIGAPWDTEHGRATAAASISQLADARNPPSSFASEQTHGDLPAAKRRRLLAPGQTSFPSKPGGAGAMAAAENPPGAGLELHRKPHAAMGSNTVNLNERVRLPGETPDSFGVTTVECRHFAVAFARHAGDKGDLVKGFATRSGITQAFTGRLALVDNEFNRLLRETPASSKHLVSGERFGTYLCAVAEALEQAGPSGGPASVNTLLSTADHVMALEVQRQTRQGQPCYAVKVYDPNATANYMEVEVRTPQELANLRFEDLLIRPELAKTYAPAGGAVTLAAICLDPRLTPGLAPLQGVASGNKPQLPGANEMLLAVSMGMPDEVRAMGRAFKAHGAALNATELLACLDAKDEEQTPALFLAMQDGHTGAIEAFGEALKSLPGLSAAQIVHLLAAEDADGASGLGAALASNRLDSAKAVCALFSKLNVDPKDALQILSPLAFRPGLSGEAALFLKQAIDEQSRRLPAAASQMPPTSPASSAE